jgi:hypothetical protein
MAKTVQEFRHDARRRKLDRIADLIDACGVACRPKDRHEVVRLWVRDDPATVMRAAANIVETAALEGDGNGDRWLPAEAVADMLRLMADKADIGQGELQ